jgi:hypothetical protein
MIFVLEEGVQPSFHHFHLQAIEPRTMTENPCFLLDGSRCALPIALLHKSTEAEMVASS